MVLPIVAASGLGASLPPASVPAFLFTTSQSLLMAFTLAILILGFFRIPYLIRELWYTRTFDMSVSDE